ncbi:hypothetical protein [Thalassobaculum sp.]|uniref:hypothetical protein n=1 Tax=Thalassobaculum sp. TaxID=2022740 RepID=UPI0032EDFF12
MRQSLKGFAVSVALLLFAAVPVYGSDVPLPDKIEIMQPAADVPENVRQFLGRWEGKWGTELNHIFIVTSVSASGAAEAIYAYGNAPKWNVTPDWHRVQGTISGNKLELPRFPNSAEVSYTLRGDGTLAGKYWHKSYLTPGTLVLVSK